MQNHQNYEVPLINSPTASIALVSTVSIQVIGSSIARRGVIFFNPGTVTLYVTPGNIPAVIGQGVPILPGAQQPFINSSDNIIQYLCSWNAIAASGSNNVLTIFEML